MTGDQKTKGNQRINERGWDEIRIDGERSGLVSSLGRTGGTRYGGEGGQGDGSKVASKCVWRVVVDGLGAVDS